ncbi:MAG: hypothetical protein ACTHLO_10265 [Pseudolabrys sp.]
MGIDLRRLSAAAVAALALAALASPADAACHITRFHFRFGQTFPAQAEVGSGQTCGFALHAGRDSVFRAIRIIAPPAHGTATARLTGVGYRAQAGYKGEDSFSFAVIGHNRDTSEPARVDVSVTVH